MDGCMMNYPPGDPRLVDKIVCQLKSQGIFDRFRKECIADVDTKPAYQNLHQRVEGTVAGFLANQEWRPELNKNQLRDSLRKHIHESGFLDVGVERIVDQVVNPKILAVLLPQIEDVVYNFLGLEKPKKKFSQNVVSLQSAKAFKPLKMETLEDLLPKDLDPISPGSVGVNSDDDNDFDTVKKEASEDPGNEDEKICDEEDSSPPFEPIEKVTHDESSLDSHLSGISGLTSHDSQTSNLSFGGECRPVCETNTLQKIPPLDLSNQDSQLSKVSSGSRLSIVFSDDQEKSDLKASPTTSDMDIQNDDSQVSNFNDLIHVEPQSVCGMAANDESNRAGESGIMKEFPSNIRGDISCEEVPAETFMFKSQASDEKNSMNELSETVKECEADDKKYGEKEKRSERKDDGKRSSASTDSRDSKRSESTSHSSDSERRKSEKDRSHRSRESSRHDDKREKDNIKSDEKIEMNKKENILEDHETKSEDKPDKDTKNRTRSIEKLDTLEDSFKENDRPDEKEKQRERSRSESKMERDSSKDRMKYDVKDGIKEKGRNEDKTDKNKHDKRLRESSKDRGKTEDKCEKDTSRKTYHEEKGKENAKDKSKSDEKDYCKEKSEKEGFKDKRHDDKGRDLSKEKVRSSEKENGKKEERGDKDNKDKKYDEKVKKDIGKDKSKHEKNERENSRDRSKHDTKPEKNRSKYDAKEKKDDRSKVEEKSKRNDKDVSKEKSKRESIDGVKHEEIDEEKKNKSRSDLKKEKERTSKEKTSRHSSEKNKSDKSKYEEKLKDVKSDGKESTSKHDSKNASEKLPNRDSKSKTRIESRERDEKSEKKDVKKEERSKEKSREEKVDRDKLEERVDKDKPKEDRMDKDKTKDEKYDSTNVLYKYKEDRIEKHKEDRIEKDKTREEKSEKEKSRDEKTEKNKSKEEKSEREKSNSSKKSEREPSSKSRSSSSGSSSAAAGDKSKEARKKESKARTSDDHSAHRERRSDDRRSTDRDSNGAPRSGQSASAGNSSGDATTHGSRKHERRAADGGGGGGGNSDAADAAEPDGSDIGAAEGIARALPIKKRPIQAAVNDSEYACDNSAGKLVLKLKKPKIAANIFEVRKIMHLRKSMAKIERKKQRDEALWSQRALESAPLSPAAPSSVSSLPSPLSPSPTSPFPASPSPASHAIDSGDGSDVDELHFFTEAEVLPDRDFLRFVRNLETSETLSELGDSDDELFFGTNAQRKKAVEESLTTTVPREVEALRISLPMDESHVPPFRGLRGEGPSTVETRGTCIRSLSREPQLGKPSIESPQLLRKIVHTTPVKSEVNEEGPRIRIQPSGSDKRERRRRDNQVRRDTPSRARAGGSTEGSDAQPEARPANPAQYLPSDISAVLGIDSGLNVTITKARSPSSESPAQTAPLQAASPACAPRGRPPKRRAAPASPAPGPTPDDSAPKRARASPVAANLSSDVVAGIVALEEPRDGVEVASSRIVCPPISVINRPPTLGLRKAKGVSPGIISYGSFISKEIVEVKVLDVDADVDGFSGTVKENNNIDKSSSDDEKGAGEDTLSKELISSALRDLMMESGLNLGASVAVAPPPSEPENGAEKPAARPSLAAAASAPAVGAGRRVKAPRGRRLGLTRPARRSASGVGGAGGALPQAGGEFVLPPSPDSDAPTPAADSKAAGAVRAVGAGPGASTGLASDLPGGHRQLRGDMGNATPEQGLCCADLQQHFQISTTKKHQHSLSSSAEQEPLADCRDSEQSFVPDNLPAMNRTRR